MRACLASASGTTWRRASIALALAALAACDGASPQALGTLEYDRITTPATASERIVAITVREGERVEAGQPLLQLEAASTRSATEAAAAEATRQRDVLAELEAGPRKEDISRARAELVAAEAQARDARSFHARARALNEQGAMADVDLDRARASAESSGARVRAARAALLELERGTRAEQIAQGQAAASAAEARAETQAVALDKLSVVAPRAGVVDSLPYRVGDQPSVGAPLAVLLVGDAPYARVYVPEPIRAHVRVGQRARVHVDGLDAPLEGRVRMVRSEPTFTPYYALSGDDAARLSYLAEIELTDPGAVGLPAGVPVRVELVRGEDAR